MFENISVWKIKQLSRAHRFQNVFPSLENENPAAFSNSSGSEKSVFEKLCFVLEWT